MSPSRLYDTECNYGWISIALHWITAAATIALWLIGNSIGAQGGKYFAETLYLHTTIALSLYVFFVARIAWRFRRGHPKRLPNQGKIAFSMGKFTHYLMLYCIMIMIISGPLMAWSGALPLQVFDVTIPAPFRPNAGVFDFLHWMHRNTSSVLMIAAALHMCGVFMHLLVPKDGTFDKMMTPGPGRPRDPS